MDTSQESKFSLPHQLSRADFGNLLFELCAKLGINNLNNEQDDISPKVINQRGVTNPLFKIECIQEGNDESLCSEINNNNNNNQDYDEEDLLQDEYRGEDSENEQSEEDDLCDVVAVPMQSDVKSQNQSNMQHDKSSSSRMLSGRRFDYS